MQNCARVLRYICLLNLASKVFSDTSTVPRTKMLRLGFVPSRSMVPLHRSPLKYPTPNISPKEIPYKPSSRTNVYLFGTKQNIREINSVAIVGGGLAGLSTAFSLLSKTSSSGQVPRITVFDTENPGCGGASAVAGGLLHPFSPTGKLVYLGKEGLDASNALVERALKYQPKCVLRDYLYRIALEDKYKTKLQETAKLYPEYATWLDASEIEKRCGTPTSIGGLKLTNGCKVIHVPTYLRGLWEACQDLSGGTATWCLERDNSSRQRSTSDWKNKLSEYDAVVLSAGSGLIEDSVLSEAMVNIPAMSVRGQSIEMSLGNSSQDYPNEAVLCGKYTSPLPGTNKFLIGATHEFKAEKMDATEVYNDLRKRSLDFLPHVWEHGQVDKVTCGFRVQTQRGKFGRIPIIGRAQTGNVHENTWLFTGLSSRGLIHHSVCGNALSDAILKDDEDVIQYPELLWWKSANKIQQ